MRFTPPLRLLSAATLLTWAALSVSAADFVFDGISYRTIDNTNNVTVIKGTAAYGPVVTLPEKVSDGTNEYTVTSISANAFDLSTAMTDITLPATLKVIENAAFFKPTKLKTITAKGAVPADITASPFASAIYTGAKLIVPDGTWLAYQTQWQRFVNVQEADAFNATVDKFMYLIISPSQKLARVEKNGYSGDVAVPATFTYDEKEYTVVEIGANAFEGVSTLSSLTLPATLKGINAYAFRNTTALKTVAVPESVEFISTGAFTGSGLQQFVFPKNMKRVENIVFQKCLSLTDVTLPDEAWYIGPSCFAGCPELASVKGGLKIKDYQSGVFSDTPKLTSFTISPIVEAIGVSAFANSGINIAELPATLTAIPGQVFKNCPNIKNLKLASTIKDVGANCFTGCTGLETAEFPEVMDKLAMSIFSGCTSLKSFAFPKGVEMIPQTFFSGCSSLTSVTIPEGVKSTGQAAFQNCTALEEITLPESMEILSNKTFLGCSALKEIIIPENCWQVGTYNFQNCKALRKAKLSSKQVDLAQSTFIGCESLQEVDLGSSLTKIYPVAFSNCTSLRTVKLPATLTYLDREVFKGCTALDEIVLPDNLETLGKGVFNGCTSLLEIVLPAKTATLDEQVFTGCVGLRKITVHATVPPAANATAFDDTHFSGTQLFVPQASLLQYSNADVWKNFTKMADVTDITADTTAAAEYYTLSGVKVTGTPAPGLYIRRTADSAAKVLVK